MRGDRRGDPLVNIFLEVSSLKPNQVLKVISFVGSERLMAGSDLPKNLGIEKLKILQLEIRDED